MYEILNIMKSVGLITRVKTCVYKWEGMENMIKQLRCLQVATHILIAHTRF